MSRAQLSKIRQFISVNAGGKGSNVDPFAKDLFASNGFNLPLTSDTGTKWVADKDGTLVQSPAGVPAMPGCRFTDGIWYSTDTDGTPLFTTDRIIRTSQGSVKQYDVTYPGVMVEPAATNKCTCRKVNPTDTTNTANAGDAAAVLSVVDDTAALTAAGLIGICTSGKVYELDNSAGVDIAYTGVYGVVGNVNKHSFRWLARALSGTGYAFMASVSGMPVISSSDYTEIVKYNHTPPSTASGIGIAANAGAVIRFIMPELIESAFLGTPVMPKPTEDGLSTVTRLADPVSFATPAWLLAHPNDFAVIQTVIPGAAGQATKHIVCNYTDANGECGVFVTADAVTLRKRSGGSNTDTSIAYTHAASVPMQYIAYSSASLGTGIAVRAYTESAWGDWTAWGTSDAAGAKANAVIAATTRIGSQTDSAGHIYGSMPMTRILRIPTNLDATALQEWLIAKAG